MQAVAAITGTEGAPLAFAPRLRPLALLLLTSP